MALCNARAIKVDRHHPPSQRIRYLLTWRPGLLAVDESPCRQDSLTVPAIFGFKRLGHRGSQYVVLLVADLALLICDVNLIE